MSVMSHIDQVFEDLKKELVSLVGDLSGVHNAVDNAKVAIAPHVVPYGSGVEPSVLAAPTEEAKNDNGTTDENEGANPNAS